MSEKTIVITGANGFIGRNLRAALERDKGVEVIGIGSGDGPDALQEALCRADVVFHLAGVNRPKDISEFATGNTGLTRAMVEILEKLGRTPRIVLSSSTQAVLDNPYGQSKKAAEDILFNFGRRTGTMIHVFRLTNVFGKWSRPNYNSVVSTFCHNISHGLPITISNPANVVELVYVDDVVKAFLAVMDGAPSGFAEAGPTHALTLGDLSEKIHALRDIRKSLVIPDLSDDFTRKLHATYLSYLDPSDFAYDLDMKTDNRGALAELIKSAQFGQMFVSRTHGGITRGNHYHDTKIEKFCVLQGEAAIRFRHVFSDETIEYRVSGEKWRVVDIPPGYMHHIVNLSGQEMIVLFWANEMFDPARPDTFFLEV
jgi:UDP-2-acetamido-2,6-beta-L-arabino-hexul-4-ose reductase